jgi:hypothetical protein
MNLSVKGIYISRHNKINSPNTHFFFKSIKTSLKIPKGYIIRSRKSKDRQHNSQKKKRTDNTMAKRKGQKDN